MVFAFLLDFSFFKMNIFFLTTPTVNFFLSMLYVLFATFIVFVKKKTEITNGISCIKQLKRTNVFLNSSK